MKISLDHYDRAILNELQADASISNLELSKKIGLSASACLARTKNLRELGVIKQFTTIVDERKLGMELLAFALVNLTPLNQETIYAFLEKVNQYPQVQECYTLTGSHDYLLTLVVKAMQDSRDFLIHHLMENVAVSRVETSVVMGVEKRTTVVPVEI